MNTKHTPGPWEIHDGGRFGRYGDDGPSVCAVTGANTCQPLFEICGPSDAETCKANSRLIAAAPDLLAACKMAVEMMGCAYVNTDLLSHTNKINYTNALVSLRSAIAKAKAEGK